MRFEQKGDCLAVELKDDGRGLDCGKIARKAVERGLIASAEGMAENDIRALIFAPGFSTAETVSAVSGRGVGMDVVKGLVDSCGGKIFIDSVPERHCLFRLVLPLVLAVSDGMLLRCGGQRFIMPLRNIKSTLCLDGTLDGGAGCVRHEERSIPLLDLRRLFAIPVPCLAAERRIAVVVEAGRGAYALEVDEVLGQQLVVSKSLPGLAGLPGISGGAILGDGGIGLVLDAEGLAALAR